MYGAPAILLVQNSTTQSTNTFENWMTCIFGMYRGESSVEDWCAMCVPSSPSGVKTGHGTFTQWTESICACSAFKEGRMKHGSNSIQDAKRPAKYGYRWKHLVRNSTHVSSVLLLKRNKRIIISDSTSGFCPLCECSMTSFHSRRRRRKHTWSTNLLHLILDGTS